MHQVAFPLVVVIVALLAPKMSALRCYDSDRGNRVISNCTSCSFCAITLSIDSNFGRPLTTNSAVSYMAVDESALGDDQAVTIQEMLREKSHEYKVLSTCMVESYDFSMFTKKPVSIESVQPEVMLRCFCAYDLCNEARSVDDFWRRLVRIEAVAVRERLYKAAAQRLSSEIFWGSGV